MSTSSPAPPTLTRLPVQTARDVEVVEYERYIDKQLRKTSSEVKLVDLVSRMLVAGVWLLAVLLTVSLVEHWAVSGGLPNWVRWCVFSGIVIAAGWYVKRHLWPLLTKRINPLYAAQTIEQHSPGLKNSLLNLLFFRQKNEKVAPAVYQAIEQQAAVGLSSAPQETPVDRTHLIRVMFAFLLLMAFGAIYKMASPKDPIASAGRVLLPWSDIKPPTRVDIQDVTPGNVSLPFGDTVEISATVRGLREGESVLLRYTTQDKQAIDREIVMEPTTGSLYRCDFPPAAKRGQPKGIQQNTEYQIVAGDAKSSLFHLTKIDRPTLTLERIELLYPEYTGFQPQTLTNGGDIRAIEGTRITVLSQANQRIASAGIDWNVDGQWDVELQVSGDAKQKASGAFTLELEADRRTPKQQSYVLRFKNERDELNYEPVRYRIDILPDYAPEVSLLSPEKEIVDVQLNETVEITIEASDPDFALSQVALKMEIEGQEIATQELLNEEFKGKFAGRWGFSPQKQKLQVGDEVTYWIVAADNRTPEANKTLTRRQRIRIVAGPAKPEGNEGEPNPNQDQANSDKQDSNQQNNKHVDENNDQQQKKNQSNDSKEDGNEGEQGESDGKASDGKGGSAGGESSNEGDSNAESSDKNSGGSGGKSGKSEENNSENNDNQPNEQGEGGKGTGEGEPNNQNQNEGADQQEGMENSDANGQKSGRKTDGSNDPAGQQNKNNAPGEQNQQNEGSEGSEKGEGNNAENSQNQEPVAKDGSDDGNAFDRMREHMNNKPSENQPEGNNADQQNGSRENPESQDVQNKNSQDETTEPKNGTENSDQKNAKDGAENKNGENTGEKGTEQNSEKESKQGNDSKNSDENNTKDGDKESTQEQSSDGKNGADEEAGDKQDGTEAKPQGDASGKDKGTEGSNKDQNPEDHPQKGKGPKENADGKNPKDGTEAPEDSESSKTQPQNSNDGKKPSDANPSDGSESGQPANDKKNKSQTAGDDSGDRSGNGSKGDGKESPQKGTGNPGDKQSAKDGSGQSKEEGQGDVSDKQGSDSATDKQTGNSENKTGEGKGQKNGEGEKPGGEPKDGKEQGNNGTKNQQGDNPTGKKEGGQEKKPADGSKEEPADGKDAQPGKEDGQGKNSRNEPGKPNQQDPRNDAAKPNDPSGGPANGHVPQGGDRGGPRGDAPDSDIPDTFQGDDANLEYTKKQTDMVLESLEDQLKNKKVDQDLLDKLNWSEKDLKQFVDRWNRRKALAKGTGKEAKEAQQKLDESLRSLGLRKRPLRRKGAAGKIDTKRKARDGYRGNVPPELQQQLQDYTRNISKKKS